MGDQVGHALADERPFYWACGKCGSAGLYRDRDFQIGDYAIVCPICGNRYYGDVGGRVKAIPPVKVYYSPASAPPAYASHSDIVTGPGRSGVRTAKKMEEESMKKGLCANCKRVMSIAGEQCCYVCYHAGKGLEGEEKAAALAAIKVKIESGGLRRCGRHGRTRKAAPKSPAAETGLADQAAGKQKQKFLRREGPCFNCGRVMQIQARDACCVCYGALRIEDDEYRELKMRGIRRKLRVKEFAADFVSAKKAAGSRQMIPDESASKAGAGKGNYPKAADIMRDVRGCLSVIILSDEEMRFIEALRAGRIAIIS